MATLLYRIGRFAARRSIAVIVGWVVILGLFVGGAQLLGGTLSTSFEIPGTESQQAIDMLDQRFPQASGGTAKVIFVAPTGGQISDFETQIAAADTSLAALDHVSGVTGPYDSNANGQVNDDGSMAFSTIQYDVPTTSLTPDDDAAVVAIGDAAATGGLTIAYANVADPPAEGIDYTEVIGLVVAFIVLLITFGSLLAAGMPLVTAVIGVAITTTTITIASGFVDISSTAPLLATMLGLAVGIDYALFIVSRHRAQLIRGMEPKESAAIAVSTAGSAVVFAALTVIIALLGLSVVQIPFLTVMGLGAAISVVIAVIVALTLLPAIMGLLGKRMTPKPTSRAARRELAAEGTHRTMGARWVKLITAKPIITVGVVVIGLAIVALPAGSMRLTLPDAGYDPPGSQSREGYDLLAEGFGPGFNGPLLVTADISKTLDINGALTALHDQFAGLDDVESVSQSIPNLTADMAIVSIIPDSAPDSVQTQDLVQTIRGMEPAFETANGFGYQVTGTTALGIDVSARLADALLPFAIVVVGLCIILLTIVFRSLAVPISATIGYLLSVGASFGIVTAVFEWGWFADLLGVAKVGPVISFFPILLMAVLFGLAMDYQVFLVSRMREEHVKGADPHTAVRHGFIGAARVVTAAACIMFAVFASFVPGGSAVLQPIALGLAAGVFIDAFLVRMTFIPALMMLLGRWAWALPAPLRRILPNVDLEGEGVREMLDATAWRPLDEGEHPFAVAAERAIVEGADSASFALRAEAGDLVVISGAASTHPEAVAAAIAGRQRVLSGHLRVLDNALPFQAATLRRNSVLVERPVDVDAPAIRLTLPPGALSVLERLRRDLGEELDDLWGPAVAAEWIYQVSLAAVSKARLVAIDGTGIPTAHLQHALGIVHGTLHLGTTIVVAHHGARLEAGVRPVVIVELSPVPRVPEPLPEIAELVPAAGVADASAPVSGPADAASDSTPAPAASDSSPVPADDDPPQNPTPSPTPEKR
ncbi:MMPL family transporter [Herbiconiux sp. P17]|uniref:MMPL family transporter n=1 Tax=Herbiconiux wuyangfengii TaxID=3342794 RepID=UPI0035B73DA3